MKTYKVGGCVRDVLLGIQPQDIDYVVIGSSIDEMKLLGYTQVGKDFPVFLHPSTREEFALARTEKKTGNGYSGFTTAFGPEVTLEEDLLRRDLTINSIAMDLDNNIIDPLNAQQDIKNKILRHTSPAFVEDPVRVLRVARFYARLFHLGFSVADETIELMKFISAGSELDHLTKERITKEIYSALSTKNPEKFFELLHATGALRHILPELDVLWGIPQPELHHPEIDTGIHAMLALQQAVKFNADVPTRLAVVLHDLGKGVTPKEKWPAHHNHEALGIDVIQNVAERLHFPKEDNILCQLVSELHLNMHRLNELTPQKIVKMMQRIDIYRKPKRIEQFALACKSDATGRTGKEELSYPQGDDFIELANILRSLDKSEILALKLPVHVLKDRLHNQQLSAVKIWKKSKQN